MICGFKGESANFCANPLESKGESMPQKQIRQIKVCVAKWTLLLAKAKRIKNFGKDLFFRFAQNGYFAQYDGVGHRFAHFG